MGSVMINLYYSEKFWGNGFNGPQKVVNNLIKSLQHENIPFAINEEKYENNFVIQYDQLGHEKHSKIEQETCIIGPQVWLFEEKGQFLVENQQYYKSIIAPSKWVKDKYVNLFSLPNNKVDIWPVGIEIPDTERNIKYDCLIYFKRRNKSELDNVIDFLNRKKLTYKILSYGSYTHSDLQEIATQCRFCFLINGTESQGIAVQEIMACGTPLFVWDLKMWNDMGEKYIVPATSIPYWNNECGKYFYDFLDMEVAFEEFYDKIGEYNPKHFVQEELSFKASVKKLLKVFVNE